MNNMLKHVLVAAHPDSVSRIPKTLDGYFTYSIATSLFEARALLAKPVDCILCGLDFDEGRMFDFLRYSKAEENTKSVPFFCIKGNAMELTPNILHSIEISLLASGASGFVPLYEWRSDLGDEPAFAKLRQLIAKST